MIELALDILRILALIIVAISGNLIWYDIKGVLSNNGFKTYKFRGHFDDLSNMSELIAKTKDLQKKKKYRRMLNSLIVVLILFIGLAFSFFVF